jgi:hypothetical protein
VWILRLNLATRPAWLLPESSPNLTDSILCCQHPTLFVMPLHAPKKMPPRTDPHVRSTACQNEDPIHGHQERPLTARSPLFERGGGNNSAGVPRHKGSCMRPPNRDQTSYSGCQAGQRRVSWVPEYDAWSLTASGARPLMSTRTVPLFFSCRKGHLVPVFWGRRSLSGAPGTGAAPACSSPAAPGCACSSWSSQRCRGQQMPSRPSHPFAVPGLHHPGLEFPGVWGGGCHEHQDGHPRSRKGDHRVEA